MVKCEIKFDNNPNGIFFAGQVKLLIKKINNKNGLKLLRFLPDTHWNCGIDD